MEVDVEVLDVNEEEARALLLSIDPLTALAETQHQLQDRDAQLATAQSESRRLLEAVLHEALTAAS
jgi:hypothetical protein